MAKPGNANYLAPGLPPQLESFILQCRKAFANPQAALALKGVIEHAKNLPQGLAVFVMGLIHKAENAIGPLDDHSLRLVLAHLAGTVLELVNHGVEENPKGMSPQAHELVKDKKKFWQAIIFNCLQIEKHMQALTQQQGPQDGSQGAPQPQGGPPPQGGPQGGPPQPPDPQPPQSVLDAIAGNNPSTKAQSTNFLESPTDGQ